MTNQEIADMIKAMVEFGKRLFMFLLLFNMLLIMLVNIFASDFIRRVYASGVSSETPLSYEQIDNILVITAAEAHNNFFEQKDVVFIDNRPSYKFKAGHIKNAINLSYEAPESDNNVMTKDQLAEIAKDKKIVFYCTGFNRAYYAAKIAIEKWGFDKNKIFWFKDGFYEWNKNGYPIE